MMEGVPGTPWSSAPSSPVYDSSSTGSTRSPFNHHESTNNTAGASSLLSPLAAPFSPRRMRFGRRTFSHPRSEMGNNMSVSSNTDRPEPAPAVRMPTKRKASSSAKPGKEYQCSSRPYSIGIPRTDEPIVKVEDIFPTSKPNLPVKPRSSIEVLEDSSEEDTADFLRSEPLQDLEHRTMVPNMRPDEIWSDRDVYTSAKRDVAPRQLSAVLVALDGGSETSVQSGIPSQGIQRMRYLPLCPASVSFDTANNGLLTVLPDHRDCIQRFHSEQAQTSMVWPIGRLPVELFDLITIHLARDDVKSMRLVNREFEQKVSCSLFHTSVVPFNTELYDMIDEDKKSKGKMKAASGEQSESFPTPGPGGLQWHNATEDKEGKVYKGHGLRVFQGFGPHIKRFGMSFEVSEKQLVQPPAKKQLDNVESYHGNYDWPTQHYTRFDNLAGLENTADETSRMKAAFSNLEVVQELALSIDSGLGWLNGPDRSLRSKVFERPTAVFGSTYSVPDHSTQAASDFWRALQRSQLSIAPNSNFKECVLESRSLPTSPDELDGLRGKAHSNTRLWSSIDAHRINNITSTGPLHRGFGVVYTATGRREAALHNNERVRLNPNELKKEQKEWLLETKWAQQAFLESYMLAITDISNFEQVTTLNISKLSSQYLPMLARGAFWDALPCLSEVILHVSPDWRLVEKDDAGFAETKPVDPSDAVHIFHKGILMEQVSMRKSIKKLNVGWVGGGEDADGMFARNANILPAPITKLRASTANTSVFGIVFKYVEHLTLSNCWITPTTLEGIVKSHTSKALKKLTLASVSLAPHPRAAANAPAGAVPAQVAQALAAAMQVQAAQMAQVQPHWQAQQPGFAPQHVVQIGPGPVNGPPPQQAMLMQQQQQQHWQNQLQQTINGNPNAAPLAALPQFPGHQAMVMQHQWNTQLQQMMNANPNAANVAPLGPPLGILAQPPPQMAALHPVAPLNHAHWTDDHREGSWPDLLNTISPGPIFQDYFPGPMPWEEPLPERAATNLRVIELISCGYVRLNNNPGFDQLPLQADLPPRLTSIWFRTRHECLKRVMLEAKDRYLGCIVQNIPQRELDALLFAWGLRHGWEDRVKAEEAAFDGLLPGGIGRISGIVERGMALVGQPADPLDPAALALGGV